MREGRENRLNMRRTYTYSMGGDRYILADGIERGEPSIKVTVELPTILELPEGHRACMQAFFEKILEDCK